jgi:hypothetical protein
MIKVKIAENGGYVVGNGDCPFTPDEFMALFMDRIMEAKRAGLTEIGLSDEDIDALKQKQIETFMAAPVTEIRETKGAKKKLFAMLDTLQMPPLFEQHV